MLLPTKKSPRKQNLHDLTILIYGRQKCGKSEFCAEAEDTVFLATEAGLKSLEVFQVPISSWDELLEVAKEVAEGKHPYKTFAIDTVDNAYRMCSEYICTKFKILHESDLAYGKGYALVNNEFHRVLTKLSLLPYGLLLVSHAQDVEIEGRTGKFHKAVPTLPETPRKIVLGMADVVAYCDVEPIKHDDGRTTYKRVLRTKPSPYWEAGDRTKRLPETIDFNFPAFAAALRAPSSGSSSQPEQAAAASEPASQAKTKTAAAAAATK
jgi:hypothetical protein